MKKIILLLAAAFVSCMVMMSCNDEEKRGEIPIPPPYEYTDDTLGGSIYIEHDDIYVEGSYDGIPLDNFEEMHSFLNVRKRSDNEIYMYCLTNWGDMFYMFTISSLPLYGMPYDVTFDNSHINTIVNIDNVEYTDVDSSVKGWIKKIDTNSPYSRMSPPIPPCYHYEINFECVVEGKILQLKITDVNY